MEASELRLEYVIAICGRTSLESRDGTTVPAVFEAAEEGEFMKSGNRSLLGVVGCGLLVFGWMAARAQVASGDGNSRYKGSNPLPRTSHENSLAKFDRDGGLVDSAVQDTGDEVHVLSPLIAFPETDEAAIVGSSGSGIGVVGDSRDQVGVKGMSIDNHAIVGISASHFGVRGETESSTGVGGIATTGNGIGGGSDGASGVFGLGKRAGVFAGNVLVNGDIAVTGFKFFRIDHPFDPTNQYLSHAAVESPDALNLYSGNVTTNSSGDATVELPSYFSSINRDFRYQLTVIGQFAQAIVANEIAKSRFTIKTDKPNVKVSWQVTGIRNDAWAKAHPIQVEQLKPEDERGTYQHPELFNQPEEKSLAWKLNPELMQEMRAIRARKH